MLLGSLYNVSPLHEHVGPHPLGPPFHLGLILETCSCELPIPKEFVRVTWGLTDRL